VTDPCIPVFLYGSNHMIIALPPQLPQVRGAEAPRGSRRECLHQPTNPPGLLEATVPTKRRTDEATKRRRDSVPRADPSGPCRGESGGDGNEMGGRVTWWPRGHTRTKRSSRVSSRKGRHNLGDKGISTSSLSSFSADSDTRRRGHLCSWWIPLRERW
jgi:hypothetical protein